MAETGYLARAKVQTEKQDVEQTKRVCFVCSGNTCRSPMAEAVANDLARRSLLALPEAIRHSLTPAIEAYSAGLYANSGEPIAINAVLALESAGIAPSAERDYHRHTAKCLSDEEAERYDLLIGMTGAHAMELLLRYPHLAKRIVCMPKAIGDPYGCDLATYRGCLEEITEGVRELLFSGEHDG